MKKSYKKIAIILSFFFFFLVLNLINFKIDNYYYLLIPIIFFIGLIVINCGYEKKRFDKEKDIILTLIISIIGYLLITYILGLKTGFTTNTYNLSFISIILNIIPVILFIITSEVFRYSVLRKGSGSKIILVLINIVLVLLDLSIYVNYLDLGSSGILKLVVLILIPSVSKNIFLSYLTIKSGIYPSIVYRFFMELKTYIVPIFPDFGMYLDSILNVLFPIFCLFITYKEINRKKDSKIRRYEGNRYFNIIWIIILFIVFITIMLSSGLFRYSLFSIGSNSMEPNINKGDIIIIERIDIDNVNDYSIDIKTIGRDYTVSFGSDYPSYLSFYTPREVVINSLSITYKDVAYERVDGDFDIQVFATNDIHGQVKETSSYPGLSKLTSKMKSVASTKDQYNIFMDQGDIYQGTAEAGLANGLNMDDFLVQNGYESVVLGNHEFDWGEQKLIDHDNYLDTTILANNIRYSSNGQSPSYCKPYKLISRNGVKIGIIGSIGNVYSSISSSKVKGIYFLYGDNLTEQIKKDSQTLKDMGAEFIILSLHDGEYSTSNGTSSLSYYDVQELSGTYVDLVLEGHSHQNYSFYDSKGVWHIQNGGNGSSFSVATLNCTYNSLSNDYEVSMSTSSSAVQRYNTFSSEDEVMSEVDSWYEEYVYGSIQSEVVGRSVPYMNSSKIKSTLSKLYYEIGIELVGENNTYTPVLGGGFISTRTPYNLSAGTVKYGDIYALLPFENDIVLCSIKGTYLLSKFINSTNSNYYIYSMIDASEVNSSETYYVITDSYSSDYKSNNLTVVKNLTLEYGVGYARDLFAQYLRDNYL